MINEHLVQQVRKGEVAIEFTVLEKDLPLLRMLAERIFPKDDEPVDGTVKYYFCWIKDGYWDSKITLPSGMVAIPLKDFFVQEEKVEEKENPHVRELHEKYKYAPVEGELINPTHKKWLPAAWEIEKVYGLTDAGEISLSKARQLTTSIIESVSLSQPKQEVDKVEGGHKYEFEKYPALTDFIQEYANHGKFSSWTGFLEELNKALIK